MNIHNHTLPLVTLLVLRYRFWPQCLFKINFQTYVLIAINKNKKKTTNTLQMQTLHMRIHHTDHWSHLHWINTTQQTYVVSLKKLFKKFILHLFS